MPCRAILCRIAIGVPLLASSCSWCLADEQVKQPSKVTKKPAAAFPAKESKSTATPFMDDPDDQVDCAWGRSAGRLRQFLSRD